MPVRRDRVKWSDEELAFLRRVTEDEGRELNAGIAREHNAAFHGGAPVRSLDALRVVRTKHGWKLNRNPVPSDPTPEKEQEVKRVEREGEIDFLAVGRKIRTLDELIAHVKLDTAKYEVHQPEATSWDTTTRNPDTGKPVTVQNHRIAFKARLKAGLSSLEQVEALLAGAFAKRKPVAVKAPKYAKSDILQGVVIADPHIGKYAWDHETGHGDYDIGIATRLLRDGAAELLEWGDREGAGRRAIYCLGDVVHYDTPLGQTTGGTALDRDGRIEKMLEEAMRTLFDIVDSAARRGPVDVVLVPGNHDAVLTVAMRQILSAYFRKDRRVTVDTRGTTRKYVTHGKCLIGLAHGDKAQKKLGELMAAEAREAWGTALCREIHHGHKHSEALVTTMAGVTIRQHPALCPPDGWHAAEGYVGAPRAMDAYLYHADGYLLGTRRSTVRSG